MTKGGRSNEPEAWLPPANRWTVRYLNRQPSRWGVGTLVVQHPEKGKAVIHLSREELRQLALAALTAMEPDE